MTMKYQVGDLIDVKPDDPLFSDQDAAEAEAKRQHDESPDDRVAIGIWEVDPEVWATELVAIYCDSWLFRQ